MGKVLCFGEILLRLSPDIQNNWTQQNLLPAYVGGAELNVAFALAKWNIPVGYCTAMPGNFLSQQLIQTIQQKKIDTSAIHLSGNRIGLYYLQQGSDMKHSTVIYDRANSSFSNLKKGMIDWAIVLKDVSWFHMSAICPAISLSVAEVCEEALKASAAQGITVSIDLNYRAKLWQYGKEPNDVMPGLMQYCDIVMGNIWAAETMLAISMHKSLKENNTKEKYLEASLYTSKQVMEQFPKCTHVANTFRFQQSSYQYYTTLFSENNFLVSQEYCSEDVIDKVGSGDCFMAGLLYGFYHQLPGQEILDFAAAAAFQKFFIKGDSTTKTAEEVKAFIKNYE